jgi:hypothetical protein
MEQEEGMNQSMLILDTPVNCECCLWLGGIILACTVCKAKGRIIEDPFSKL